MSIDLVTQGQGTPTKQVRDDGVILSTNNRVYSTGNPMTSATRKLL